MSFQSRLRELKSKQPRCKHCGSLLHMDGTYTSENFDMRFLYRCNNCGKKAELKAIPDVEAYNNGL